LSLLAYVPTTAELDKLNILQLGCITTGVFAMSNGIPLLDK
jgi:hypothetical protein